MDSEAIRFIGASIQLYGHFDCCSIPYASGRSIATTQDVTKDEFIRLTYEYFTNKKRINYDYRDDLKDQNATKRFICSKVNFKSYMLGHQWLQQQQFKN